MRNWPVPRSSLSSNLEISSAASLILISSNIDRDDIMPIPSDVLKILAVSSTEKVGNLWAIEIEKELAVISSVTCILGRFDLQATGLGYFTSDPGFSAFIPVS
jgi:hypothetical protein